VNLRFSLGFASRERFILLGPAPIGHALVMAIRPSTGVLVERRHLEAPLELVLYHDVLCAWCYVADARLEYLRDEYGQLVRFRLRPYPLRPDTQIPDKKQRGVLARQVRRVTREPEGALVKADLWTGRDPPASSIPALAALEAALVQGPSAQRELLVAMRKAALHEGINVARRDVQVELAAQAGLDVSRFLDQLDDPRHAQEVTAAVEEADAIGIRGSPALVIGGEWLMQGCRELAEYRHVIDKYLHERVAQAPLRLMH
jgi:predicted DsbA family dithiol-disulfide isomerase